jgi:acetyl-CoA synthetase
MRALARCCPNCWRFAAFILSTGPKVVRAILPLNLPAPRTDGRHWRRRRTRRQCSITPPVLRVRPKGVLHAHRSLLGVLPGVELCLDFFGHKGDFMWSPADWAWLGGLLVVLLPTWAHGKPILVQESGGRFDPERAYHILARQGVRNVLLVATMLKLMRQVVQPPALGLRSIFMGGESVGEELLGWGEAHFGVPLAECYGQTECAMAVAHAPRLMSAKPGALGRPAPGHRAAILDADGQPLPPGEVGEIALARPDYTG